MSSRAFILLALLATTASCGQDPTAAVLRAESAADSAGTPSDSSPPASPIPEDSANVPPDSLHTPPTTPDSSPDDDGTGVVTGAVTAARVSGGVRVTNGTTRPVAYAVWNPDWLALFGPCVDSGPGCPRLPAGASMVVPDSAIAGQTTGAKRAVVRWWHVVPDGAGGNRADLVREILVAL